jgi:uncharacterized repeat protein (TIGR01451 family)
MQRSNRSTSRLPLSKVQILCCVALALSWNARAQAQKSHITKQATGNRQTVDHGTRTEPAPQPTDLEALVRSGWVQIVRFESPIGATVEIASTSGSVALEIPATIGLASGQPYRLRVSNIPDRPGITLYPTIQLLGYIMPPPQVDPAEYPIPIHFLDRDVDDVDAGRMLSNVVFLEDPLFALPVAFPPGEVPVLDVRAGEDPLIRASDLGRPIVLIQVGNRVPLDDRLDSGPEDPPVYVVPAPVYRSGNDPDPSVRHTGWSGGLVAAPGAMSSVATGHSHPLCSSYLPISRLPYKVHPRMPFDECLPDGGDLIPYVHFNAYDQITGLGASETVAQFSRPGERPRVVPSNQVCLYAPRFGLVRSASVSIAGLYLEGPGTVDHRVRRAAMESRTSASSRIRNDRSRLLRLRESPITVAMREPPAALDELRVIAAITTRDYFEILTGRTGPNTLEQSDEARIAMSIEAAKTWQLDQFPAYTALTQSGAQISGTAVTGEIQQVKPPILRPGELVLRKMVTPHAAKAGDIVEFVIDYTNVGQTTLESISIIDSLTARLEYVPNSAQTDRRAVFSAAPNDVGSQELRWDISDPLPGGEHGVVWFQAKVR